MDFRAVPLDLRSQLGKLQKENDSLRKTLNTQAIVLQEADERILKLVCAFFLLAFKLTGSQENFPAMASQIEKLTINYDTQARAIEILNKRVFHLVTLFDIVFSSANSS